MFSILARWSNIKSKNNAIFAYIAAAVCARWFGKKTGALCRKHKKRRFPKEASFFAVI